MWRSLLRLRRSVYGGEHRRELDDRLDFDLVSLDAARGSAGKVCRTVVREHLEVRARVICRGRVYLGGASRAQIEKRACATTAIYLHRWSSALRQVSNRIPPVQVYRCDASRTAMAGGRSCAVLRRIIIHVKSNPHAFTAYANPPGVYVCVFLARVQPPFGHVHIEGSGLFKHPVHGCYARGAPLRGIIDH